MKLQERLLAALDKQRMPKGELARQLGVSPGTITNYLNGDREPELKQIERMAEILQTTPIYLLGYDIEEKVLGHIAAASKIAKALRGTPEEIQKTANTLVTRWNHAQTALNEVRVKIDQIENELALAFMEINEASSRQTRLPGESAGAPEKPQTEAQRAAEAAARKYDRRHGK